MYPVTLISPCWYVTDLTTGRRHGPFAHHAEAEAARDRLHREEPAVAWTITSTAARRRIAPDPRPPALLLR